MIQIDFDSSREMFFSSIFDTISVECSPDLGYCYVAYEKNNINVYLQNGAVCDQDPVSVHTTLASPTSECPSLQLNVTNEPTAYFRLVADAVAPSMRPFMGACGCEHCMAAFYKYKRVKYSMK